MKQNVVYKIKSTTKPQKIDSPDQMDAIRDIDKKKNATLDFIGRTRVDFIG